MNAQLDAAREKLDALQGGGNILLRGGRTTTYVEVERRSIQGGRGSEWMIWMKDGNASTGLSTMCWPMAAAVIVAQAALLGRERAAPRTPGGDPIDDFGPGRALEGRLRLELAAGVVELGVEQAQGVRSPMWVMARYEMDKSPRMRRESMATVGTWDVVEAWLDLQLAQLIIADGVIEVPDAA